MNILVKLAKQERPGSRHRGILQDEGNMAGLGLSLLEIASSSLIS